MNILRPDPLGGEPFSSRLVGLHGLIRALPGLEAVGRMAVTAYDPETDELKTFAFSDASEHPLHLYSARLSSVPSLCDLAASGAMRVVSNLAEYARPESHHSAVIMKAYKSSFTLPVRKGKELYGFLFFNAEPADFFSEDVIARILPYAQLMVALAIIEFDRARTLKAAVLTVRDIGHLRDDETGAHLLRMAAYTRIIAVGLAPQLGKDDAWVEMLTYFAPMHDIGKVAIPDSILFKPGRLDPDEFAIMKEHVAAGMKIVDTLLENFGLSDSVSGQILRDIVGCHHESIDGKGYPRGLAGDAVPIAARIVTVADVFDALTSVRPYKKAWPIEEAMAFITQNIGIKFAAECVEVLAANLHRVAAVRERFPDSEGA